MYLNLLIRLFCCFHCLSQEVAIIIIIISYCITILESPLHAVKVYLINNCIIESEKHSCTANNTNNNSIPF